MTAMSASPLQCPPTNWAAPRPPSNRLWAALGSTVKVETEAGLAKLSLVGIGMRSHSGVGATAFKALADANIKIGMISTSEIKIAVMVDESDIEEAARVVHKAFNLGA